MMVNLPSVRLSQMETAYGSLLNELQTIWYDMGESDAKKDGMLLELEQECLEIYRRKVDQANRSRAQMRQTIADYEAELAAICSALGERPVHIGQNIGTLKEELRIIVPHVEEMRKRKSDRRIQFLEVLEQIKKTSAEIGDPEHYPSTMAVDETDLSLRRLEDLNKLLQSLQKEKADRLKQVMDHVNTLYSLCSVLGLDFKQTVHEVQRGLDITHGPKNVSNDVIEKLESAIGRWRAVKIERMQKLQDLATSMFEMWNLMDTPIEEQQKFQHVTCNIAASEHERTEPNSLSADFINYVENEVSKLEVVKASKMKELVLKKKTELEELRHRTHLVGEEDVDAGIEAMENGSVDPALVLEQIEVQISAMKEEAFSRKEILERVEKWLAACEEESWLEEYSRDENRYNAGRGTHLMLKRAEKARVVASKIPAMMEALTSKITSWENERGIELAYDGVGLLSMLEEYTTLRQEKEQERKRQREQKRLQGQVIAEQEVLSGSKPSPLKTQSSKKMSRTLTMGSNKRQSQAGAASQTPKAELLNSKSMSSAKKADATTTPYTGRKDQDAREQENPRRPFTPLGTENRSRPSTPSQTSVANAEEGFTTPSTLTVAPGTPKTARIPMQMAATPAPSTEPVPEFSVEELRLASLIKG